MPGFQCATCGQWHEELPDLGFAFPDYWQPNEEESATCYLKDDYCRIDDDFFLRGCLEIPIVDRGDDFFAYGIWLSTSETNFGKYREHLADSDRHVGDRYVGYVSNELPGMEGCRELVGAATLRRDFRPAIELEPSDHPLSNLQRTGIEFAALLETLDDFLH